MATPDAPPKPATAAPTAGGLRIVLFGLPGAGKSSLLGALAQAAVNGAPALALSTLSEVVSFVERNGESVKSVESALEEGARLVLYTRSE